MGLIRQLLTGFRVDGDAEPGVIVKDDGTTWLVNADGSETQLPGGGGSQPITTNDGSPLGTVVPSEIGALVLDTTNGALWQAVGATNADWVQIGGAAAAGFGVTTSADHASWQVADSSPGIVGFNQDDTTDSGTTHPVCQAGRNILDDGTALASAKYLGGIGFWNHAAPVAQPATPVTLADVIALLQAYGLSA